MMVDKVEFYRDCIKRFLLTQSDLEGKDGVLNQPIFDDERDQYLVLSQGWRGQERVYWVLMHLEIRDGKVWIQRNQTELDVEGQLVELGVAASDLVRGLIPPEYRALTKLNS